MVELKEDYCTEEKNGSVERKNKLDLPRDVTGDMGSVHSEEVSLWPSVFAPESCKLLQDIFSQVHTDFL